MTDQEFTAYWELLCERHGKTPSAPLTRVYAMTIKQEDLSAQEWAAAVTTSIRFDQFMPSAQQLIDHARTSFKDQAMEEWDACMARMRRGDMVTEPNSATRKILNSVTHGRPLGEMQIDRMDWLKREFVERYAKHLQEDAKAEMRIALPTSQKRELTHGR